MGLTDKLTIPNVKKFLKDYSGVRLPRPGYVGQLDDVAEKFAKTLNINEREKLVENTITIKDNFSDDFLKSQSTVYLKYMQKVIEKGDEFLMTESTRLEKLKKEKISKEKKEDIE